MENNQKQDDKTVLKKTRRIILILFIILILSITALAARIVYLNFFIRDNTTSVVPDNIIDGTVDENDSTGSDDVGNETGSDDVGNETGSDDVENETDSDDVENETDSNDAENGEGSDTETDGSPSNDGNSDEMQDTQKNPAEISLFKGKPTDNERFQVSNMFPGDVEVKYFQVKVSHIDTVAVFFAAEVTEQTKMLGDILHIKVTYLDTNKLLYDGIFNDMTAEGYKEIFSKVPANETTAYYKIEVSLPTSAGNEYQASMLKANFKWFVTDEASLGPPQTGDDAPVMILAVLSGSALIVLAALFIYHRKRGG